MIRIIANGVELDIKENTKFSLTKKNPLFSFDNIELERTTNISIPATPKNVTVFAYANDYHTSGQAVRKQLDAQLYIGVVVYTGYLYVSSCDDNDFNCTFVTGANFILKKIKDAGSIKSYYFPDDVLASQGAQATDAVNIFDTIYYQTNRVKGEFASLNCSPSYDLYKVIQGCLNALGVPFRLDSRMENNRLILDSLSFGTKFVMTSQPSTSGTKKNELSINMVDSTYFSKGGKINVYNVFGQVFDTGGSPRYNWKFYANQLAYELDAFVANDQIEITFGSDFRRDVALVIDYIGGETLGGDPETLFFGNFFGSDVRIEFDQVSGQLRYIHGTIAGKTFAIPRGANFGFVTIADEEFTGGTSAAQHSVGYIEQVITPPAFVDGMPFFEGDFEIKGASGVATLYDNLEDRTLTDILKDICNIYGVLMYVENGVLILDDTLESLLNSGDYFTLENIISQSDYVRKFADFEQVNTIDFESVGVPSALRLNVQYFVDNLILKKENNLHTISWNEGEAEGKDVFIYYKEDGGNFDDLGNNTIAVARVGSGDYFMERVTKHKNRLIEELCIKSTQITVTCRMSILLYNSIREKTLLWHNGCKWMWRESKWNDNVATFTLAKI